MTLCDQCHESQHKKNFEKPIGFIFGKLGKRLIYQSDLEEIIHSARPQRVLKRKFFRKTAGKGGIKKKTL